MKIFIALTLFLAALMVVPNSGFASGRGGSFSSPSQTAPVINPVEKCQ
jgi:hypothetical protein